MKASFAFRLGRVVSSAFLITLLIGLWVYHTVLVSSKNDFQNETIDAKKISKKCSNLVWFEHCYGKELSTLTLEKSLPYGKETLIAIQDIDKRAYSCHVIAHYIAWAYIKNNPSKWKDLMSFNGEDFCNYGYVHGMIEARQAYDKGFHLDEATMASLCHYVKNITEVYYAEQECYHGFGHIVLADTKGNIDKALEVCTQVFKNFQSSCSAGIFMENFTKDNLVTIGIKKEVWDEKLVEKEEQLCRQYTGNFALGCWQVMAHLYGAVNSFVPSKVFEACNRAPLQIYRDRCMTRASTGLFQFGKLSDLQYICMPFKDDDNRYKNCLVSNVDVSLNTSVRFMDRVVTFCNTAAFSDSLKNVCFSKIGEVLKSRVSAHEQSDLCNLIRQQPYKKLCTS